MPLRTLYISCCLIQIRRIMNTITEKISTDENRNINIFKKACDILKDGGLVAFPTETVYGLGADALNPVKRSMRRRGGRLIIRLSFMLLLPRQRRKLQCLTKGR